MYSPAGPSTSTSPPILPSGEFTWHVEEFSKQDKKLYSKSFIVGTREWRLLLFPRGNPSAGGSESVALYLDYPEAAITPSHLCPTARFELIAVNREKPENNVTREASHKFTESANDWGFTQFVAVRELTKGFVVDDTLTVKVSIALEEDRYQRAQEARQLTGCVGVRCKVEPHNLEAWSSGLSALVQCLYHLPMFRKAVYQLPEFSVSGPEHAFSRELRRTFFQLQYSSMCVMCDNLSRAAGCPENIADILELAEDLVSRLSGTGADDVHNELFVGQCRNFLEATTPGVDHRTSEEEQFVDLSLDIEGCKTVYESLVAFCREEKLEGPNQICIEGQHFADGRRYTRLQRLPPVLRLQPKRFAYDSDSSSIVKINGHFEFYSHIDLAPFRKDIMCEGNQHLETMGYMLHSIVVHLGTPLECSYCVYVRKDQGGRWIKLDGDEVAEVSEREAIYSNYGSDTASDASAVSTAVVLVYIREDEWDNVVCPVDKFDIPEKIRLELEDELAEASKSMAGPAEGHLYVDVKIVTEDDLQRLSPDLHCLELVAPDRRILSYRMHKHDTVEDVRRKLRRDLGVLPDPNKLWVWQKRPNLMRVATRSNTSNRLIDLKSQRDTSGHLANNKNVLMTIPMYLQEPDILNWSTDSADSVLLFFKFFDPFQGTLEFLGERTIPRHSPLDLFWDDLCQMANLPEGVEIDLYGDPRNDLDNSAMWPFLDRSSSPHKLWLQDGEVICIERRRTAEELASVPRATLPAYMSYWASRVKLNCRPFQDREDPGFELNMLMRSAYDVVCSEIALYIGIEDWRMLRLHVMDAAGIPTPIKYSFENMDLKTGANWRTIVLYEVLDRPLPVWERQHGS